MSAEMAPAAAADPPVTPRDARKAERRALLLRAAARLVAERGYRGVRLEDLGAAAGISGPAVYRHFASKEALLGDLLTDISGRLLAGAEDVVARRLAPQQTLHALVEFHLDFTLGEPDLIRIQDRDLHNLPDSAGRYVRRTQRRYVEIWAAAMRATEPRLSLADARVTAHATFGLLNSTPHSVGAAKPAHAREILLRIALAAPAHAAG